MDNYLINKMVICWTTLVCTGFYVTHVPMGTNIPQQWSIRDSEGLLIFVPRTMHVMRSLEPLLQLHDLERGYIVFDDLLKVSDQEWSQKHLELTTEERSQLVMMAEKENHHDVVITQLIVEYSWTSDHLDNEMTLTRLLPIRVC